MSRDLQAENLTISVPSADPRCDKNCPYCVAKLTGLMESNTSLMFRNLEKVKAVAKAAGVTSVLFTGKGEPVLNLDFVRSVAEHFREFPLEIQTNGVQLLKSLAPENWLPVTPHGEYDDLVLRLDRAGFNVIALSMDNDRQFSQYIPLIKRINHFGMVVRLTVNLTKKLDRSAAQLVSYCIENGVRQLTLRRIVSPEHHVDPEVAKWIEDNGLSDEEYGGVVYNLERLLRKRGRKIRTLNEGTELWDLEGISIAHSDYCVQERAEAGGIRSLVFQEDGHLYTSWNSPASILF